MEGVRSGEVDMAASLEALRRIHSTSATQHDDLSLEVRMWGQRRNRTPDRTLDFTQTDFTDSAKSHEI